MSNSNKISVKKITIPSGQEGQRLDNYLRKLLPGVPNSLIYKIIRDGQVRVNSGRVRPLYRLKTDDIVRIPPVSIDSKPEFISRALIKDLKKIVLYEDEDFMVVNKPAGIAVHSGTNIKNDIISSLRTMEKYKNLSLVHRLDKNTSGCLILAKNYHTASKLGKTFQSSNIEKHYLSLLAGTLKGDKIAIDQPIMKNRNNHENSVSISDKGKAALSYITLLKQFKECCLVDINIKTGRMHQIRVHAASIDQPVCGDTKYGHVETNKLLRNHGLKRMFLHSKKISFYFKQQHDIEAPTPEDLSLVIANLKNEL